VAIRIFCVFWIVQNSSALGHNTLTEFIVFAMWQHMSQQRFRSLIIPSWIICNCWLSVCADVRAGGYTCREAGGWGSVSEYKALQHIQQTAHTAWDVLSFRAGVYWHCRTIPEAYRYQNQHHISFTSLHHSAWGATYLGKCQGIYLPKVRNIFSCPEVIREYIVLWVLLTQCSRVTEMKVLGLCILCR